MPAMENDHPLAAARDLARFIDASPSPWHAVAECIARAQARGFRPLEEAEPWNLQPGDARYVVRDDASIILFRVGAAPLTESGLRIAGAHTDSPGLRVKPHALRRRDPWWALDVEVYGGPILATFTDRDLTLAGRVLVEEGGTTAQRLFHVPEPLVRIPNLPIHLNRGVNEEGLKLDRQDQLLPLFLPVQQGTTDPDFRTWLGERLEVAGEAVRAWDLALADTQGARLYGPGEAFIAAPQMDNLASCHAGLEALLAAEAPEATLVCAFFDHEEVGSESYRGAAGTFLEATVSRIAEALGCTGADLQRALARSQVLSADMAHAYHPGSPGVYDEGHRLAVNAGPALKVNAQARYTSDGRGRARFEALCEAAGVPFQHYVHRNDLPCGSTIGPMVAARLGAPTLDIGTPLWGMHSLRESGGARDQDYLLRLLGEFFRR